MTDECIQKHHMSVDELAILNKHWQERAQWAEKEVDRLRNVVTLLEQRSTLDVDEERERCALIAASRPHHSGLEIAELIRTLP